MQLSASTQSRAAAKCTSSTGRTMLQPVCSARRTAAFTSTQQQQPAFKPQGSLSIVARRQMAQAVAPRSVARGVRAMAVKAEISYVMVKPDGVQRGLVGEIISRFERKGFKLVGLKLYQTPKEVAEEHYKDLKEKPFYGKLVEYIVSGPVVAMVWEGNGVVASARKLIGATNPLASEPGTIRGDFAIEVGRNIIHGSDSVENGERETALWFKEGEVTSWAQHMEPWLKE